MERSYGFTSDGNSFSFLFCLLASFNICVLSDVWNKIKLLNFLECLLEPLHYPIMVHSTKRSHWVNSLASRRVESIIVTVAVGMSTRDLFIGRCQVEKSLLPLSQGVSGLDESNVSSTVLDKWIQWNQVRLSPHLLPLRTFSPIFIPHSSELKIVWGGEINSSNLDVLRFGVRLVEDSIYGELISLPLSPSPSVCWLSSASGCMSYVDFLCEMHSKISSLLPWCSSQQFEITTSSLLLLLLSLVKRHLSSLPSPPYHFHFEIWLPPVAWLTGLSITTIPLLSLPPLATPRITDDFITTIRLHPVQDL